MTIEGLAPEVGLELNVRLMGQYGEPHRKFHTIKHLCDLLGHLRWFEHDCEHYHDEIHDRAVLLWSIAFHDWFYVPGAQDNEERSADAAVGFLGLHWEPGFGKYERILQVKRAILATKHHRPVDDLTSPEGYSVGLMCDCDLAVLGIEPEDYRRASEQVYEEFVPVVGWSAFGRGRLEWIQGMLDRPRLFSHLEFHERFEERARANLRRERSELSYNLTAVWVHPDEWDETKKEKE